MKNKSTRLAARDVLERTDRQSLDASVAEARLAYPGQRLLVVVADARSYDGAYVLALCEEAASADAERVIANLRRNVEKARRERMRTGRIRIRMACGPVETFREICVERGGEYLTLLPGLDEPNTADGEVKVAAFGIADVMVATLLPAKTKRGAWS